METQIIHVVPAVSNESSGVTYATTRLCDSLVDLGLNVSLVAMEWGPIERPPEFLRTFPVGLGPRRLGRSPGMLRWLMDQADARRLGVIHNHGMWQMNSIYPARVSRKHGVPLIVSPHGSWSEWAMSSGSIAKKPFWHLLQRPAMLRATCFHVTSETEYAEVRNLGFTQPIAVVPIGIDIPPLRKERLSSDRTLLFLGRINPKKGLDLLLSAWGAVQARFPEWRLRIVGSDEGYYGSSGYMSELKSLAAALGLQRIEFSGALHGAAKWQAYADSDLFVLPTYSENFGLSIAEALASGTPALVSKGAPWSGLDARRAGRWIDIGVDPLVAGLEDLLQREPRELRDMGINGRTWMTEAYSWRTIGQRMAELYHWLARGSAGVPSFVITS